MTIEQKIKEIETDLELIEYLASIKANVKGRWALNSFKQALEVIRELKRITDYNQLCADNAIAEVAKLKAENESLNALISHLHDNGHQLALMENTDLLKENAALKAQVDRVRDTKGLKDLFLTGVTVKEKIRNFGFETEIYTNILYDYFERHIGNTTQIESTANAIVDNTLKAIQNYILGGEGGK